MKITAFILIVALSSYFGYQIGLTINQDSLKKTTVDFTFPIGETESHEKGNEGKEKGETEKDLKDNYLNFVTLFNLSDQEIYLAVGYSEHHDLLVFDVLVPPPKILL